MKMALRMLFPCIMRICIKIHSQEYDREFRTKSKRQFETLLTSSLNDGRNTYMESQVEVDEVAKAVKELKKRKVPGYDNILNEHILHGGPVLLQVSPTLFGSSIFHLDGTVVL